MRHRLGNKKVGGVALGVAAAVALAAASATAGDARSTDDVARDLANSNSALASITLRAQYRGYAGEHSEANDQSSTTILFQPTLPFPLDDGRTLFVRPGIPFLIDQPTLDGVGFARPGIALGEPGRGSLDFDVGEKTGLGDTTVDVQYGETREDGLLWSIGGTLTAPTATDDRLGTDRWALGPGFQLGRLGPKSVAGVYAYHQWDFAGSGDTEVDVTVAQLFGVYLPAGGWEIGTQPIVSYNHESHDWNVPLNLTVGRTVILGGRPWKLGFEVNYYVERPDRFSPRFMVGINVAPVVENVLATWFD